MAGEFSHEDILPDVALGDVKLPRQQAGNSPQSAAVMLLAEFGIKPRSWFPSGALVALLRDFSTSDVSARAVVNRLAKRGVLEGTRRGRNTFYRVSEPAAAALIRGGHAMATFAREAESWDFRWTLVAVSGALDGENQLRTLRGRLRWRGYVPLYDGLWISPQKPSDLLISVLEKASRSEITLFRSEHVELNRDATRNPLDVWDLPAVAAHYEAFLARWSPLLPRVRAGEVTGVESLRARIEAEDDYRRFVVLDPRLPLRLMPPGWPRQRARDTFAALYGGLAMPALRHVQEVVAQFTDEPPDLLVHSLEDLAEGALLDQDEQVRPRA